MFKFVKKFSDKHPTMSEILRFLITGTIATLVEMLIMGIIIFAVDPAIYSHNFLNVFIYGKIAQTWLVVIASAVGFLVGLVINYFMSTFYVYKGENKFSKTARGVLLFALLSTAGLAIQSFGMLLLYGVLKFNEWLAKILLVIIVIAFNYITRKFFIYNDKRNVIIEKVE